MLVLVSDGQLCWSWCRMASCAGLGVGWPAVLVLVSDGQLCWSWCRMASCAGLGVGWPAVLVLVSDGQLCWSWCRMASCAGLGVGWPAVLVLVSDGQLCWSWCRMASCAGLGVGWLLNVPATCGLNLGDGPAQTILRAATLIQIKLAISQSLYTDTGPAGPNADHTSARLLA